MTRQKINLSYQLSVHEKTVYLFITSTYRDLTDFFAPLAPATGRLDNNDSNESALTAGVGNAEVALEGGKIGIPSFVIGVAGTVVTCGGMGVIGETPRGGGVAAAAGAFDAGRFGGGGATVAFFGTSPA